jgi:hypothetical protein
MINNKPYNVWKYENILEQSMFITRMSEGSITLTDIDNMTLKDRDFYYESLIELNKKRQEMLKEKSRHSK